MGKTLSEKNFPVPFEVVLTLHGSRVLEQVVGSGSVMKLLA